MNSKNPSTIQKALPAISVLMSVHNGERYLKESVESILTQTFTDFEFIIIDDASIDTTANILESFAQKDPRIIVIRNGQNLGLTKSLNKGLNLARAEYVARMDADDISLPERLQIQKDFLDHNPHIVCVGSSTIIIDEHSKKLGIKKPPTNPELLRFHMMLKNQMTHSSVMFRKESILSEGGYNEQLPYTQDYDLWSRLLMAGKNMANIEEALVTYRSHAGAITQGKTRETAYALATATVYKNISKYINADKTDIQAFIETFHKQRVGSIHELLIFKRILRDFTHSYIQKEEVSVENSFRIKQYVSAENKKAILQYLKKRLGVLYKTISSVKRKMYSKK